MDLTLAIDLAVNGLVIGCIYGLVALGLNLQYGLMRIMNIAHGEFVMLGAYLTFSLATFAGISPLATIPVAMVLLFALGMGLHFTIFRRLARTSASAGDAESRSLIVGFGLMFIVQNAATVTWGGGLSGMPYLDKPITIGSTVIVANRLLIIACMAAVSLALVFTLKRTLIGKAVRGMLEAPLGALLVGIDTKKLHPACFATGLALAGLAGGLLSLVYELSPNMGEPYTISALVVITLGGLGNLVGGLVGAILLGLIESFGMYLGSPSMKPLLTYGVFVLIVLLRPRGLFSK